MKETPKLISMAEDLTAETLRDKRVVAVPVDRFVIQDCRFQVRDGTNDRDVVRSVFEGEYAVPDVRQYEEGATSIDVGAHVGSYSVWACATYPVLNVLAVEPLPENLVLWEENRRLNVLMGRMKAVQRAAGPEKDERVEIVYPDPSTESGAMHRFVGSAGKAEGRKSIVVPVVTLANLMEMALSLFGARKIWTLKLDCEKGELPLLKEANKEDLKRIKWVVGEEHGTAEEVRAVLEKCKFVARRMGANQNKSLFCYENAVEFGKM